MASYIHAKQLRPVSPIYVKLKNIKTVLFAERTIVFKISDIYFQNGDYIDGYFKNKIPLKKAVKILLGILIPSIEIIIL